MLSVKGRISQKISFYLPISRQFALLGSQGIVVNAQSPFFLRKVAMDCHNIWFHRPNSSVIKRTVHQCGPESILGLGVICGLSLLLVLVLAPKGFLRVLRFSPLLTNQHFQIPIRSWILPSTISWASVSGDCASTSRVIDIKSITLFYYFSLHEKRLRSIRKCCINSLFRMWELDLTGPRSLI